jgi:amine acid ABC transporter, permease protein, 3-TM region, His/Glu/Gln/Arg/opine family
MPDSADVMSYAVEVLKTLDPLCGPAGIVRFIADGTLMACGNDGWGDEIIRGFYLTMALAVVTLPIGLALGFFVALAKQSESRLLTISSNIYTTIFRGLPELLTIFMIYYGLQIAVRNLLGLMGIQSSFEINAFAGGVIALTLVFSAYASEVLNSAFKAIPKGQYEAGYALGMHRSTTMRLIILPQLLRIALPGLGNLWMNLLKDTALISVIGLADILFNAYNAARMTKQAFYFLAIATLLYLVLAILSSIVFSRIEKRARRAEMAR